MQYGEVQPAGCIRAPRLAEIKSPIFDALMNVQDRSHTVNLDYKKGYEPWQGATIANPRNS